MAEQDTSKLPNFFLIDETRYEHLAEEVWSQDLQGDFADFKQFQAAEWFLAFYSVQEKEIIAAVSTGLVYHGALEIEVLPANTRGRDL